ncbi:MAG: hypothetical protein LBK67_08245 [Coriobacteriales bacterium]|jgi:hypothetical protein|nr:hypothetical protein [Coriobacteriales bacterium]
MTTERERSYQPATYEPDTKIWKLNINPERTWDDTPLSLAIYVRRGIYSLDARQSLAWVRDRLLPPHRHTINHILRELNMSEYDEAAFIEKTRGVSANDHIYLMARDDAAINAAPVDSKS